MAYIAPTEACAGGFEPVEILHDGGEGEWAVARAATGRTRDPLEWLRRETHRISRHRMGRLCGSSSLIR